MAQKLYVLKLEISHGSDRHEISMYNDHQPTVDELLNELERKTRVPYRQIQLLFKGQKLHMNPNAPLAQFGIFSGSRLLMVGEKLNATQDAIFRRILGVNKDVALIEKTLNDTLHEFSLIQNSLIDRSLGKDIIPQMHQKVCGYRKDLEAFHRVIDELVIDSNELPEVRNHQIKTLNLISNHLNKCNSLLQQLANVSNSKK